MVESKPDRVKICTANPDVVKQAVANWLEYRKSHERNRDASLCVAINDGGGYGADEFCHCEAYKALDKSDHALSETVVSAQNLLHNGSFENGLQGWRYGRWHPDSVERKNAYPKDEETTIASGDAYDGDKYAAIKAKSENRCSPTV